MSWAELSSRRRHSWMNAYSWPSKHWHPGGVNALPVFSFWQHKGSHTTCIKCSRILLWSNVYPRCVGSSNQVIASPWISWIHIFCIAGDIAASSSAEDCCVFPQPQPAENLHRPCYMLMWTAMKCTLCMFIMSLTSGNAAIRWKTWPEELQPSDLYEAVSSALASRSTIEKTDMDTVQRQFLEWCDVQLCTTIRYKAYNFYTWDIYILYYRCTV